MRQPSRHEYFPAIDILRGFAAYSVIVLHVIAHTSWDTFPLSGPLSWFRSGNLGVDLFFVISGFVVYYNASDLFSKSNYQNFIISYSIRRASRIYPLYIATMIASIFVSQRYLLDSPHLWRHIISHLFFIHSFNIDWFSSINGVNWSIAIEVHFYILIALMIRWLGGPRLVVACVCAVGIAWLWRWGSWTLTPNDESELYLYRLFVLSTQLPGRLDQFGAGMLVAALVRSGAFARWRDSAWLLPASVVVAASATFVFVFPQIPLWSSGEVAFVLAPTTYAMAFAAMVFAACQFASPRFLELSAPLRYCGTISYGLYLWHLPIILLLKQTTMSPLSVCVLTLVGTTGMATLSWYLLEKPLIRASRKCETALLGSVPYDRMLPR